MNIKKICFFLFLIKKGIRANNDKNWIKLENCSAFTARPSDIIKSPNEVRLLFIGKISF